MKNNKSRAIIIALLILLIVLAVAGIWAFSKYTSSLSGTGAATVAKWSFKSGESTTTVTGVTLSDGTLNSKVANGKIAPGTDGNVSVNLDASGSEVAINYTVTISNITNKPTNLKFYSDSAFENELTGSTSYTLTGTIALADVANAVDLPIYWKWDYETASGDATDTSDSGKAMSFDISITGVQADPRS